MRQISPDARARLVILAGVAVALLVLPPVRNYPVLDDGPYAQAVQHLQVTGRYALPDSTIASLVALAWWGSLFVTALGPGFTTLTLSTLVLATVGLLATYSLFRAGGLAPGRALFGTALLAVNPLFFHLSYSFMTDVPYLTMLLLGTLAALRGLRLGDDRWLAIAALLGALAALIRQPGAILILAIGVELWRTRRLTVRRVGILAAGLVPVGLFLVWVAAQPSTLATTGAPDVLAHRFANPIIGIITTVILAGLILTSLGCVLWPLAALARPTRAGWLGVLTGALIAGVLGLSFLVTLANPGPDRVIEMPLDGTGSTLSRTGFVILSARPPSDRSVLTPAIWMLVSVAVIVVTAAILAALGRRLLRLRGPLRRPDTSPIQFIYLIGAIQGLMLFTSYTLYDRYLLAVTPFLILWALRALPPATPRRWALAGGALAALALFVGLAQADFADRSAARWAGGRALISRGVPGRSIDGGFEWTPMYDHDALGNRLPAGAPAGATATPQPYLLAESALSGYHIVASVPYFSRLGGFTWRDALVLARDSP